MRVLTQVPPQYLELVRRRFPDVEFVELPMTGPVGRVDGDVLFTWPAMVDVGLHRARAAALGAGPPRFVADARPIRSATEQEGSVR